MKVLVLVVCLVAVSTVCGVEFEVEEMEKRNMRHHNRVVVVEKPEDDVAPVAEVEAGTEEDKSVNTGVPSDEPPSYVNGDGGDDSGEDDSGEDDSGDAAPQKAGAQTPMGFTTAILLASFFVLVFV